MDEQYLINEYITKKRTCNDIAKDLKRDPKTVWSWLKKYNIPTRPRGGDSSTGSFKKGSNLWVGKKHNEETKQKIRDARFRDGHVPYLRNGEHWLKSVASSAHPNYKNGLSPERQSFYSSIEWVELVKKVWRRDNSICKNCGKHHDTETIRGNFHIHHIISFQVKEKRFDLDNLVLLCKECHRWVHSKKNSNNKFLIKWETR